RLYVRTRSLAVAAATKFGEDKPAWESRHIDIQLDGDLDAKTGKTSAAVSLFDTQLIGRASVDTTLDLAALVDHPSLWLAMLTETPLEAQLVVPRRPVSSFASLPSVVAEKLPRMTGDVELDAKVTGSIASPVLVSHVAGWSLADASSSNELGSSPWAMPV